MHLLWGKFLASVHEVRGDRARVSFRHPSESAPVRMWVSTSEAGILPKSDLFFSGGGIQGACHDCGCAFEECECA